MKRVNLHIFNDTRGFFSGKIVSYITTIQPGENKFINISANCNNKTAQVEYSSIDVFLKNNHKADIKSVIFHSYNYFNKGFIKKVRTAYPDSNIKFIWIFWSHEYYQLPEFFTQLYQGFSRKLYLRKLISFHVQQVLLFFKGEADSPFYGGLTTFKKTFKEFDLFCAFLEGDYTIVMKDVHNVPYSFVSYLSVKDFSETPNDLSCVKTDILVGHAGSPILNHYEIVRTLSDMNVGNKILIPLSYGKGVYIKDLGVELAKFKNLDIECQTDFLSKGAYYKKIENIGFFILNSFCQQALGNIVFFLWAGTKIFLRKNTSTYQTLKQQGFHLFSIEDDLNQNGLVPLTLQQKQHNHRLLSSLISEDNVRKDWLKILEFGN